MKLFEIKYPTADPIPILISIPHSGTHFPADIIEQYHPKKIDYPEDTDWYVDSLYDFAPDLGITTIKANYHRWVIDLNRHHDSKPLYDDGRNITELCPTSTFNNEPLYKEGNLPDAKEIERRIANFYQPYYDQVETLLRDFVAKYEIAVLWDAHSIKQHVPGIRKEVFPDLILGDNDGKSANSGLIDIVWNQLTEGKYKVSHNDPFKGGNITRHFGQPEEGIHAMQLEMTKLNYMDNQEKIYDKTRAAHVKDLLISTFSSLGEKLPHDKL